MGELEQARTASVLNIIVGIWLAISTIWISITGGALTSLYIVAGVLIFFGIVQLFTASSLPGWINALAAIWLFIAAFAFTGVSHSVRVNEVITAVVAFVLALWDSVEVTQYNTRHPAGA